MSNPFGFSDFSGYTNPLIGRVPTSQEDLQNWQISGGPQGMNLTSGFIQTPDGGALIPDPQNPGNTIPISAEAWRSGVFPGGPNENAYNMANSGAADRLNAANPHTSGGFLGNLGNIVPGALGYLTGGAIGGALGSQALGNIETGRPVGQNLTQAGGVDLAALGTGVGLTGNIGSGLGLVGKGLGLAGMAGNRPSGGNTSGGNMAGGGVLDTLGNLSPAILAGFLGNRQRQDVMGQVGKLNQLGDQFGQGGAYLNSITNPYDLQTGAGRTALTQSLGQRGVGGSSFGNQQLNNYDYMRGLGRGDLATKAAVGLGSLQGGLYGTALQGMVGSNQAYNNLLGAGLGASGSLFGKPGNLGGGLGGLLGGAGGFLNNFWNPSGPTDPNAPVNYSGGDPSQFGDLGGNWDPNTGMPVSGGGGMFDTNPVNFSGGGNDFFDFGALDKIGSQIPGTNQGGYGWGNLGNIQAPTGNGLYDWLGANTYG